MPFENGAELDLQNKYGATAPMLAAYKGHLNVVNFLVEKGAALTINNKENKTALDYAKDKGYKEIVKVILEAAKNKKISEEK